MTWIKRSSVQALMRKKVLIFSANRKVNVCDVTNEITVHMQNKEEIKIPSCSCYFKP